MASSVLHSDTKEAQKTHGTTERLIAIEDKFGAHNYKPLDVVVERAEGCWIYDVEGRKYLDLLAAYSAVNQGHCHPRILAAMQEQAQRVTLTSRAFRNDQLPLFLKEISELTGFEMTLPMNMAVAKEIEIRGTFRFHEEFDLALELMAKRLVNLKPLLTAVLPLDRAREAFDLAGDRSKSMKVQLAF